MKAALLSREEAAIVRKHEQAIREALAHGMVNFDKIQPGLNATAFKLFDEANRVAKETDQ